MYKVINFENDVRTFNSDEELLKFAQLIYSENDNYYPSEIHWMPENIMQAKEYIHEYCDGLVLLEK